LSSSQAADLFAEFQSLMGQINGTRAKILRLPPRKNNAGDAKLQKSIHKATAEILEQLHFSLPKLPTVQEVDNMQVCRSMGVDLFPSSPPAPLFLGGGG